MLESNDLYYHMIDEIEDYAILLLDESGHVMNWNKGAQKIKGYTSEEIVGKNFSQFYTRSDRERHLPETLIKTAKQKGKASDEGWRVKKDGSQFWASVLITAVHGEKNEVIGFSKVTRDLTEKKLSEEREISLGIMEEIEDYGILLLDVNGHVKNWNKGAEKVKGYSTEEIIGKHFSIFYREEDRLKKLPDNLLEIAKQKGKASDEGWRVKKDGSLFWGSILITAVHDKLNNIIGYSKITRDLTEKKMAEEREVSFKVMEEIEDYGILLLDEGGNVKNWNRGAEKIKGYTSEEIVGKNFSTFYTAEDRKKKLPESLLNTAKLKGKASDEGWRVKKDGTLFWASILITAIHDKQNQVIGYSKITRDLTDKKIAEETEKSLWQAREGLFKILHAAPAGMIMTDVDTKKTVEINKFFLETFGYAREEVVGFTAGELGILTDESKKRIASKLKNNSHLKNEHVVCLSKSGEEINCIVSTDFFEMDGKTYLLSAYHNINEKLKAEETEKALAQSKKGFMTLFNASPSGMIVADIDSGRLLEVNASFLDIFKYKREEAIGFTANELGFVSDETQAKTFGKLKEQGYLRNENVPTKDKDGKHIDTIFSVDFFEMDGKPCFLCIFHDISDMKEMERKITESEIKYRKIIEDAGDVLYTSDVQGKFSYINQRVSTLTEYTGEELIGQHFSILVVPEWQERVRDSYLAQFINLVPETVMEFLIHTKSGKLKWVEQVVIMQMEKGVVTGFQCVVHDITERKNANLLMAEQKQIIEQKNKDILDSIVYAKRIQDAIFPPEELVKELLPQSFILFKPKEVISGDFYWVEKFDNKTFIAAVDCTGHGVPGALLSIIGYNLLSKSINEHGFTKPDEILNELSNGINKTLRKTVENNGVKDTMDIALCSIDTSTNTLEYAGAYNSLYLVRKDELIVVPANRFPIGVFSNGELQKFTNHVVQLQKDDMIFLFSDGYPDQFGGPAGKKLMYKNFKKILLSIQKLPVEEQKLALNKAIEDWRSKNEEQTDDILVIGIRV